MPKKKDCDSTPGAKLLTMFNKLMVSGRKHYQADLASELCCSAQTVMRLAGEIEYFMGAKYETGIEGHRRWYRIKSVNQRTLGIDSEEVRYLSLCRDLSVGVLPDSVLNRIDKAIFNLAMGVAQKPLVGFIGKGCINYEPHLYKIERLVSAIEKNLVCFISYKAPLKTEVKDYHFVPKKMLNMNNALYVIGGCLDVELIECKHPVSLAVHRIEQVSLTNKSICFDLPDISLGLFGLPWHEPRKFVIHFKSGKAAEYVRERVWSDEQTITDKEDGGLILEITTQSEPELTAWVRSFGEEAEMEEK